MNIISKMAIAMASLASQNTLWAINHSRSWYSYPTSTKRITGHAKINRAAKKRRARKWAKKETEFTSESMVINIGIFGWLVTFTDASIY
ncbi:hypothetical protein QS817_18910 [Providencia rettgeri]|nr:hypothetical protein [Providencia rettgeri]MDL9985199.1 hypothetical protein [Providencia rettgeri]